MAIKRQKSPWINTRGQESFRETYGIASFSGTGTTVTIPIPFSGKKIAAWALAILGAPALAGNIVAEPAVALAAISATQIFEITASAAGTAAFNFTVSTTVAASDSTFWSVGVINKTQANAVVVDSTAAANSSKATGGSAITAYTPFNLTVAAGTVAVGDVLEVTFTKTSTPGNLVEFEFNTSITTGASAVESLYLNEAANESNGLISVQNGVVTIGRAGVPAASFTSGLRFSFIFRGY